MTDDSVDQISKQLESLDLEQEAELTALVQKHCIAKSKLLKRLQGKKPEALEIPPRILSHSKIPLQRGDRVVIRSKASIGRKGDIAIVLSVSAPRIDIHVPCLDDTT